MIECISTSGVPLGALTGVARAVIGAVVQYYLTRKGHREVAAKLANIESLPTVHEMLLRIPDALRFEGLTEEDRDTLQRARISHEETVYLLVQFKAGARLHHRPKRMDASPYGSEEYRYPSLRAEAIPPRPSLNPVGIYR